jgi:hypothetical protein
LEGLFPIVDLLEILVVLTFLAKLDDNVGISCAECIHACPLALEIDDITHGREVLAGYNVDSHFEVFLELIAKHLQVAFAGDVEWDQLSDAFHQVLDLLVLLALVELNAEKLVYHVLVKG